MAEFGAAIEVARDDGSNGDDANSYVSVEDAIAYHTLRNNTTFTALDETQKKGVLVRAASYITMRWGNLFVGEEKSQTQLLSFPRNNATLKDGITITGIPTAIKYAQCEYALEAIDGDLFEARRARDVASDDSGVGDLRESKQYDRRVRVDRARSSRIIADMSFAEFAADMLVEKLLKLSNYARVTPIVGGLDEIQRFDSRQFAGALATDKFGDRTFIDDGSLPASYNY